MNLKICKIDECEKINEKVKNAINKNMRENFDDVIDREITSIHNIDFENEVDVTKKIKIFDFFACRSRI